MSDIYQDEERDCIQLYVQFHETKMKLCLCACDDATFRHIKRYPLHIVGGQSFRFISILPRMFANSISLNLDLSCSLVVL